MSANCERSSVITVDCQYLRPRHAAAYLLAERDCVAFVENNTAHAVPLLMEALENAGYGPEDVAYIIITHLHFDHAGGTSALVKRCPKAQVLCHPVAVRHLVDPSRLVASAKRVYGDERFEELYGEVGPVPAERVRAVNDGETLVLGERTLTFLHTPGHARHHICIYDSKSNGAFTGDTFGLTHTSPELNSKVCLVFSSAPTDFDPDLARDSIRRVRQTGAQRIYLTHYGEYTDLDVGEAQVLESIDALEAVLNAARATDLAGDALQDFCEERVRQAFERQFARWRVSVGDEDWKWLTDDLRINAMGLAYLVERERR